MKYQKGTSGNPSGRPKGAANKRTELLRAIEQTFEQGETGFWLKVTELAKDGDSSAISLVANRLVPTLKPVTNETVADLGSANIFEDVQRVLQSMGTGELSVETATGLLTALNSAARTREITDLELRIERLERETGNDEATGKPAKTIRM
jgi:hypothetical protein